MFCRNTHQTQPLIQNLFKHQYLGQENSGLITATEPFHGGRKGAMFTASLFLFLNRRSITAALAIQTRK